MELLIFAGLSLVGYKLSKQNQTYDEPVFDIPETRQQQFVQEEPMTHSNMVPFYKSQRTQNTNDGVKDRRLATFTGINNIEFEKKKEVFQPPPERDITKINGTTFQPDIERYQNFFTSNKHDNISPVQKQYIGPGLGSNNPNPGFHDPFRILPDNINVYRKNNLVGSTNHGKSNIDQRSSSPGDHTSTSRKIDHTEYFNNANSYIPGMMHRPTTLLTEPETYQCAPPNGPSSHVNAHLLHSQQFTIKPDTSTCLNGNPHGQINAHGPAPHYLIHHNERDNTNCHILNTQLPTASVQRHYETTDVSTLRDSENCHRLNLHSNDHRTQNNTFVNTPTQRGVDCNTMISHPSYTSGGVHSNTPSTNIQTQRDTENCHQTHPHLSGPSNYTSAYSADPNLSREYAVLTERTPIAGRMNIPLDNKHLDVDMKQDQNTTSQLVGGLFAQSVNNFTSNEGKNTYYTTKAIEHENNRAFGYIQENPLSIRIN